jgi:hypothetical protein
MAASVAGAIDRARGPLHTAGGELSRNATVLRLMRPPLCLASLQPVLRLALTASLAVTAACSTVSTSAPADVHIEGDWQLNAALSDDVAARTRLFVALQEQKLRAQRSRQRGTQGEQAGDDLGDDAGDPDGADTGPEGGGGPGAGGGEPGGSPGGPGGRGSRSGRGGQNQAQGGVGGLGVMNAYALRELRSQLELALAAPRSLRIERSGELVSIAADGLPARTYRPGEVFSRIDEIGTAQMAAGWKAPAFLLSTRYSNRIVRAERYELDARAGRLLVTRTFDAPRIGKLELRSLYERR